MTEREEAPAQKPHFHFEPLFGSEKIEHMDAPWVGLRGPFWTSTFTLVYECTMTNCPLMLHLHPGRTPPAVSNDQSSETHRHVEFFGVRHEFLYPYYTLKFYTDQQPLVYECRRTDCTRHMDLEEPPKNAYPPGL